MVSRTALAWFFIIAFTAIMLFEIVAETLLRFALNDPNITFPLTSILLRVLAAFMLLIFESLNLLSLTIGFIAGAFTLEDIVTQFIWVAQKFLDVIAAITVPLLDLAGVALELLIVRFVLAMFEFDTGGKDLTERDIKLRRG